MFMYLHSCAHIKPSIRSYINTSTHRYIHRYKSAYIGRKIDTKNYKNIFRTHHSTLPCNTIQRSTVQYSTIQDRQYATPRYSTTQHIRTNTQYIMLFLFPSLTLDYLHCISSYYIILHYVALQYSALQWCNSKGTNRNAHVGTYIENGCIHRYDGSSIDTYAHTYGKHPYILSHTHMDIDTEMHRCINTQHATMFYTAFHIRRSCENRTYTGACMFSLCSASESWQSIASCSHIETYIDT